ncbi:MAG: oligosaccharide flippase family protein, partial [Litorimonas sp.]
RFTSTSIGIFRLFDKFTVLAVEALVMPTIRFGGALYAASQGWGLTGFALAWFMGSFCQYIFLWTAGLLELRRRGILGRVLRSRMRFFRPRRPIWGFVVKSNIDSTLATGVMHLPQLLVMAMFGPVWNGVFKIAEEVAKLLTEGFKLLDQVIYPELAKLVSAGRADRIWRIVTRAAAVLLSVGLAFSALIFLFGEPALTGIFGPTYAEAVPLAVLLVPAAALMGAAAPLYPIFYATDRPGRAILIRGASLLVYIGVFFTAAHLIGRLAPGIASIAANLFSVIILVFAARAAIRSARSRQPVETEVKA